MLSVAVVCSGLHGPCAGMADEELTAELKRAIAADSAMMHGDFEKLTADPGGPNPSEVADKSLTLMLLGLKIRDGEHAGDEFRYLTADGIPKPLVLARELYRERRTGSRRILLEPITFIHQDRITDLTYEFGGGKASGTVAFKAPDLFQGKAGFVAESRRDQWLITEFTMPAYGLHLVRSRDGFWTQKR